METINDKDIFGTDVEPVQNTEDWDQRQAVKMIIFDDQKKIALVGTKYMLFPGGGIELGENIEQAAKREAEEEVGCKIKNINIIGEILELKSKIKRRQITTFVTAELDGEKGLPTTKQEDEQGIKIYWLSREEAIKVLEEQETSIPLESYNSKFNARTNNIFIKKI